MRVKELISIALFAALGTSAQAQIVSSQSQQVVVTDTVKPEKPKMPRSFKWNIKAGFSLDNLNGTDEATWEVTPGFDVDFGLLLNDNGLLYGASMGIMSHGSHMKDVFGGYQNATFRSYGIVIDPIIGYSFPITNAVSIAPYVGPFVGYQLKGSREYDGKEHFRIGGHFDAGINVGLDCYLNKNLYVDFHYKRSFSSSGEIWYKKTYSNKLVLGIGYLF